MEYPVGALFIATWYDGGYRFAPAVVTESKVKTKKGKLSEGSFTVKIYPSLQPGEPLVLTINNELHQIQNRKGEQYRLTEPNEKERASAEKVMREMDALVAKEAAKPKRELPPELKAANAERKLTQKTDKLGGSTAKIEILDKAYKFLSPERQKMWEQIKPGMTVKVALEKLSKVADKVDPQYFLGICNTRAHRLIRIGEE